MNALPIFAAVSLQVGLAIMALFGPQSPAVASTTKKYTHKTEIVTVNTSPANLLNLLFFSFALDRSDALENQRQRHLIFSIVRQVFIGPMSVIAKYALNAGLAPRVLIAERLIIAATILTPLALIFGRNTRPQMTARIFAQIVIMSIFEPLLEQNLYYTGMKLTSATFASGLFNLLPAITFVMACAFGLEKVAIHSHRGKSKVLGTCVAVGGAMMMTFWRGHLIPLPWTRSLHSKKVHMHDEDILRGGLMIVSSCLSWSFYVILQAKVIVSYPAKLSLTALICIIGAIGSTVTALIWERNDPKAWKIYPNVTLLASLYGGCFSATTVYVVGWMAQKKGPLFVSIFNPINLITTAVISSVVLSEPMFVGRIIGAFVIIIGMISLVLWGKMEETSPPPPPPEPDATTRL